jgi:asparagine synthase (glutamine-hydrolysing)/amidotransferase
LFHAIQGRSTVALSGESADEVFGGYAWFHDPAAIARPGFPWSLDDTGFGNVLDPGLKAQLRPESYVRDRYAEALAEVPRLPGETGEAARLREVSYLALTRFLPVLLDRKDRMSMAVGLEVRVPFCDHRLVEYVFNVPWRMKSFDGREKSLLRAATADLLPRSIVERVKTPYPATQDPGYERSLRNGLADLVYDANAPVLPLLDMNRVNKTLGRSVGEVSLPYDRGSLEMTLWLNAWLVKYGVTLDI